MVKFTKVTCNSVEEAKKRALVIAYLTYNCKTKLFLKFCTLEMLQNPQHLMNSFDYHNLFDFDACNISPDS